MAEASSSPRKVILKRKIGGLMMYPWQINQPQPSPLAQTLSVTTVAMQMLQDNHTSGHSHFLQDSYNFPLLFLPFVMNILTFVIKVILNH